MLFDELRQKPKHVRSRYAFWLAVASTSVIGGVWLALMTLNLDVDSLIPGRGENYAGSAGAFSRFLDDVRGGFPDAKEEVEPEPVNDEKEESAEDIKPSAPIQIATSTGRGNSNRTSVQLATSSATEAEKSD